MSKPPPRKYPQKDIKHLYGRAAARCAFPKCRKDIILDPNPKDGRKQIGKIAHIVGHSDNGPRGDASYPREKLDTYDNWILLCPTCHDIVDALASNYTTSGLRALKSDHEQWVNDRLATEIPNVGFAELEVVTRAILAADTAGAGDLILTPPKKKIEKNRLTIKSQRLIMMGLGNAQEVARFVEHIAQLDSGFPERLKAGFTKEYDRLKGEGYIGDDLFMELLEFAGGPPEDFARRAAGLAVLSYLFERCDIFDK